MYEIFGHPELVQQFTVTVLTSEITVTTNCTTVFTCRKRRRRR